MNFTEKKEMRRLRVIIQELLIYLYEMNIIDEIIIHQDNDKI